MTTEAAAHDYLCQHLAVHRGKALAVHNPNGVPLDQLPVIFGFNNGRSPGWYSGKILAEDGTEMGGHICSHEGYMMTDLGILEGTRGDRHETFKAHYPSGYRMAWVETSELATHEAFNEAVKKHAAKYPEAA